MSSKVALITGAAGNVGSKLAAKFASDNFELILVDKELNKLEGLASELSHANVQISLYECDFLSHSQRELVLSTILERHTRLDVLVNNAAYVGDSRIVGWVSDLGQMSLDIWRDALEVNLTSVIHLVQKLEPVLLNTPNSAVVSISSIYAQKAPNWSLYEGTSMGNPAAYGVSKAGLEQLTRWLASVLSPNTRVNAIAPGGIARGQPAVFEDRYLSTVPLGRMAHEHDVVEAVAFLTSQSSSYITGQVLTLDGGRSIV